MKKHMKTITTIINSAFAAVIFTMGILTAGTVIAQVRGPNGISFAPSESVQEAWVARYNGPGNGFDRSNAVALDGIGNVYVTGPSLGSGSNQDYATIKYNASGQQEWVTRYNGPGNGNDDARAIAVDASGNVYVTGPSLGSGGQNDHDYATIKYNSAGQEQWVARYNGPGNGTDGAAAIAVDGSGNVYVTGHSLGSGGQSDYDYATIKYNSAGQEQWVARYDGSGFDDEAAAIAIDPSGNIYVTGFSKRSGVNFNTTDYTTIKYNSAGQEQWVRKYNGQAFQRNHAKAIAVDGLGNVYVTGEIFGTSYYATIKYNSAGQQLWVRRYSNGHNYESARAIALDGLGNIYVTGWSGSDTALDYATVKYNSTGQEQWVARYNGPANNDDGA